MIIAIDTGGTKTLVEAFAPDGTKQHIARFATPKDTSDYVTALIEALSGHVEDDTVFVIAVPGWMRDGIIERCPNLEWSDFDLIAALREYFPDNTFYLENDAELAGLSESRACETPPELAMYLTVSTGIGGGLAYRGELAPITARFEPGKAHLWHDGQLQRWEVFASGRAFFERYGKYGHEVDNPEIWREFADLVARGMMVHIPVFMPDVVIIGGSMGTHFAKYEAFLRNALTEHIPHYMTHTKIIQAAHPEEAVVYGGYHYALDQQART
jgi:glucokinase